MAMGTLAAMVRSLSAKFDELESGATCPGDWVRLHAAVMRAAIAARQQVACMCPSEQERETLGELVDQLFFMKLGAEAHLAVEQAR